MKKLLFALLVLGAANAFAMEYKFTPLQSAVQTAYVEEVQRLAP